MRVIKAASLTKQVAQMCIEAGHKLPGDVLAAIKKAAGEEEGVSKRILDLCVTNADIAEKELIPLCQDTGVAVIFADIGRDIFIEGDIYAAIEEGVRQGYKEGYLRKSIVADPLFERKNTADNTPPIVHYNFVAGDKIKLTLMLKGAGSENNSKLEMFAPSASLQDIEAFILKTITAAGAKSCPPLVIGIGIGGNFETCPLMAKSALRRSIGERSKDARYADLERGLLNKINALNIGPQGLGGKTTALDIFIEFAPCHMASLPVAINICCHSNRHISRVI